MRIVFFMQWELNLKFHVEKYELRKRANLETFEHSHGQQSILMLFSFEMLVPSLSQTHTTDCEVQQ